MITGYPDEWDQPMIAYRNDLSYRFNVAVEQTKTQETIYLLCDVVQVIAKRGGAYRIIVNSSIPIYEPSALFTVKNIHTVALYCDSILVYFIRIYLGTDEPLDDYYVISLFSKCELFAELAKMCEEFSQRKGISMMPVMHCSSIGNPYIPRLVTVLSRVGMIDPYGEDWVENRWERRWILTSVVKYLWRRIRIGSGVSRCGVAGQAR